MAGNLEKHRKQSNSINQLFIFSLIIIHTCFTAEASIAHPLNDLFKTIQSQHEHSRALERIIKEPEIRDIISKHDTHELNPTQQVDDPSPIKTTKFQHYYKGLEVVGSMAIHHTSDQGSFVRNRLFQFDLDAQPRLTPDEAISIAHSYEPEFTLTAAPQLRILPNPKDHAVQLVYWLEAHGTEFGAQGKDILINAHSGSLIAILPREYTIAPIQIFSAKKSGYKATPIVQVNSSTHRKKIKGCNLEDLSTGSTRETTVEECKAIYKGTSHHVKGHCQLIDGLDGMPIDLDPTSCQKVSFDSSSSARNDRDPAVSSAAQNSKKVLDYFHNHFQRNSYDNKGSTLTSVIHAGEAMANAFWMVDQNVMVYGDGDGETTGDFTQAVDVAGHEMTHGITSHTADLVMMGESGALNEGFSDFFGKMIENKQNWIMGGALFLPSVETPGIRNLENPGALTSSILDASGNVIEKPYPSKLSEAAALDHSEPCTGRNDGCWVHFNSTIFSHAAYLITQAIGSEKSELLFYTVLTHNLTQTETFESAAQATLDTCRHLNFSKEECQAVKSIYHRQGLSPS